MRLQWPLTGRAEEIRLIDAGLSTTDVAGVVIHGAAGAGKSRVAREALKLAASRGCQCRWAVGTSAARSLPLAPFTPWVPAAGSDSLQLVRDVIESLTSAPEGVGVVVGVDDAHLLDDLSTFVLLGAHRRRDCPRLAGPVLYRRPQPRRHRRSLAGAACRSPPVRSPRPGALGPMTSHYCRDPDGNLIEVASYSARD